MPDGGAVSRSLSSRDFRKLRLRECRAMSLAAMLVAVVLGWRGRREPKCNGRAKGLYLRQLLRAAMQILHLVVESRLLPGW